MSDDYSPQSVESRAADVRSAEVVPARSNALQLIARSAFARRIFARRDAAIAIGEADVDATPRVKRSMPWSLLSFIALVIIPSLGAIVYFCLFASDQFVAEARMAVRTANFDFGRDSRGKSGGEASSKAAASSVGLPSLADQDAFVVAAYVRSQAAIQDISGKVDVRAAYSRPEADVWARLPRDASAEKLLLYWRSMVSAHVDALSGIVTIEVRAFRPDDALKLAQELIGASERLVNDLSARARADAVLRAEQEVRRSEALVQTAMADMRAYRDAEGFISPLSQANSTATLLLQAMSERIRLQNDYFVAARAMSTNAPTVATLRSRLTALDEQIERLKAGLTGKSDAGARTVAASIVRFEELELKRQFAEKLYAMSQDALERARQRAERQTSYVSVFVPPRLPEEALFPRRLSMSLLIPIGLLIIWGIGAMLAATIKDHGY